MSICQYRIVHVIKLNPCGVEHEYIILCRRDYLDPNNMNLLYYYNLLCIFSIFRKKFQTQDFPILSNFQISLFVNILSTWTVLVFRVCLGGQDLPPPPHFCGTSTLHKREKNVASMCENVLRFSKQLPRPAPPPFFCFLKS